MTRINAGIQRAQKPRIAPFQRSVPALFQRLFLVYSHFPLRPPHIGNDLSQRGGIELRQRGHVAELPVVGDDTPLRGEHERRIAVMAGLVDNVKQWRALVRTARGFAVAAGAVGVEKCLAVAVLGGRRRELDPGEDVSLALAASAREGGGRDDRR